MSELPIVFLGPSVRLAEARSILDADYRPPVRRGDFDCIGSRLVLVVDGEFAQSLSVSPKEILGCIARGGVVYGTSSMGALRAAELEGLGMSGLGWVFEAYRTGRVIGDDEVALTFSPLDHRPLTVPLINVRYWLECLEAEEELARSDVMSALRAARGLFYAERTPDALARVLNETLGADRYTALVARTGGEIPDVKAEDTRSALRLVQSIHGTS